MTPHIVTREMRRQLARENAKLPEYLQLVPSDQLLSMQGMSKYPRAVWRSRYFLVQEFIEVDGIRRLSIARSEVDPANGRWKDGISWEELQNIKRQVGYGNHMAVEIFPTDRDVVNVANMRHLWVLATPLPFGWTKS